MINDTWYSVDPKKYQLVQKKHSKRTNSPTRSENLDKSSREKDNYYDDSKYGGFNRRHQFYATTFKLTPFPILGKYILLL